MKITKDNVIPSGARYLIEAFTQATETEAGLELSQGDGFATSVVGTVVRSGAGCRFGEGDILMFRRYSVDSLRVYTELGEQELYFLDDSEVLGIVQDNSVSKVDNYKQITDKKIHAVEKAQGVQEEGDAEKDSR